MDWCSDFGLVDVDTQVGWHRVRWHVAGDGPPLVLLHGNPTHAFLWRHVLAPLRGHFRCLAVDLTGFGGSSEQHDFGVAEHAKIVAPAVRQLVGAEEPLTWLAHDWGAAIAFNAADILADQARHAVAFTEGHLNWIPTWDSADPGFAALFRPLRDPELGHRLVLDDNAFVEDVLLGSLPQLTEDERAVYRQPFESRERRRAILALARQVPVLGDTDSMIQPLATVATALGDPELPKLSLHAHPGAVIDDAYRRWLTTNSRNLTDVCIGRSGHFTPEEQPGPLAQAFLSWCTSDSSPSRADPSA